MTKQEFEKHVRGFFAWTAQHDRPITSWLASLESWARYEYNAETVREKAAEKKS